MNEDKDFAPAGLFCHGANGSNKTLLVSIVRGDSHEVRSWIPRKCYGPLNVTDFARCIRRNRNCDRGIGHVGSALAAEHFVGVCRRSLSSRCYQDWNTIRAFGMVAT